MDTQNNQEKFIAQIPILNLSQGSDMLSDFTTEALSHLMSAENALLTLETLPEDKESIDSIFKIFHTIRGLAEFLNLKDIFYLAQKAEDVVGRVRKSSWKFEGEIADLVSDIIDSLRKLLTLLNDQIINEGKLSKPYHDITQLIKKINELIARKKVHGIDETKKVLPAPEKSKKIDIPSVQLLESLTSEKDESVFVETKLLLDVLREIKHFQHELSATEDKLLHRQRELIKERDFALKLSQQSQDTARFHRDFIASMAHDIRTLITSILGFSDILMREPMEGRQKERIQTIASSATLLLGIVSNVLDYSKILKGQLKIEAIPFNLELLIEEICRILRSRIEEKHLKFTYTLEEGISPILVGDPTRLKQVILNLVDNAIKFTKEGSVRLNIQQEKEALAPSDENDKMILRFAVSDTGIGIPEEKKDAIFESYVQADLSTTRQFGGTGLGLSICRSYVELMGGKIWVESQFGKGSTFIFMAEFGIGKEEDAAGISAREGIDQWQKKIEEGDCSGAKVLVAEDSIPNQELIQVYLESFACEGDFVASGKEAVEKIQNNQYDICFMDLQMPIMGGLEATQIIRNELKNNIPIIALTAAAQEEEKQRCFDIGINDYISKPFTLIELKEKIIKYAKTKKE